MKFQDYPYTRPDLQAIETELASLKDRLENAKTYEEFKTAFFDYDAFMAEVMTQAEIANVRHTIDTRDEFYRQEADFLDEMSPVLSNLQTGLTCVILQSPFADQLRQDVPHTWFQINEGFLKTMKPEIVEDLKKENKLASEYQKLVASAQIEFDGKTYTLASLEEKMNDKDRKVRERAHKAYWGWFADHEKELGDIYDQLVKIRHEMALKLGYENFIPVGYLRMSRMDYDQNDVEVYRKNVLKDVVPVAMDLYRRQAKRLDTEGDQLPVWNEKVEFETGNPNPIHTIDEMVDIAQNMYHELSDETGEFFDHMKENELLSLKATLGKAAGGYCTGFLTYERPFIFANCNGTQGDVEVLTHEAGHAFQAWSSRKIRPVDCIWPTSESAEIDSMSMEFFTWPWMENFFGDKADQYRFVHLSGAVKFIPYGVLVDHFQHEVYAHPEWNNDQRMACWRELEKQYLPQKDYTDVDFLERGGWWMRQLHIFLDPFYYIDYTLAQVAALQFWDRMMKKDPKAFEDYKAICKAGGTKSFRELIELANLKVPFEEGCLEETMTTVSNWLDNQDVSRFE